MRSRRLLAIAALSAMLLGCNGAQRSEEASSDPPGDFSGDAEKSEIDIQEYSINGKWKPIIGAALRTGEVRWYDFVSSKNCVHQFLIQFEVPQGNADIIAEEFPMPFSGYDGVATAEHAKNYRGEPDKTTTFYFIAFSKQMKTREHFYLRMRGEGFKRTSHYTLISCLDMSDTLASLEHLSHDYKTYTWANDKTHRATCSECGHVDKQPHVIASGAKPDHWGYYTCSLCGGKATRGFTKEINEEAY